MRIVVAWAHVSVRHADLLFSLTLSLLLLSLNFLLITVLGEAILQLVVLYN